MKDELSTKAGIFETGKNDEYKVGYKDNRLIHCYNNTLTEYAVADGTEIICDRAFLDCKELQRITLPSSVKAIGSGAFSGCRSLREINIPEGVRVIKQGTFRDCDSLTELDLPESVEKLEKHSLGPALETLTLRGTNVEIEKFAPYDCGKSLKAINAPEVAKYKYIMECFRNGCTGLVESKEEFDRIVDEYQKMTEGK